MKPFRDSRCWIQAPCTSLTDDLPCAVLVLRLALAVNALRSQQRHTVLIGDEPESAPARRDGVLSFVTAAAFTAEALNILTGTARISGQSAAVKTLALRAGVPVELLAAISHLMAGTHPASALLVRIRNQLTFHWDPAIVQESVVQFAADEPLIWMEGDAPTAGGSIYRLAADVLANALVLDRADVPDGEADAEGAKALAAACEVIVEAMVSVAEYLEYAIAGYLEPYATGMPAAPDAPSSFG